MQTAGRGEYRELSFAVDLERTSTGAEDRAWPWEEPMPLKLRVISDQYKQLGKASSQLFGVHGGNIGRASDNDWVLPDPDRYVSSHHAKVSFRAGNWILEDVSTNGIFVNDSDTPLAVSGPRKLKDGDRLRFGDYDIIVSIEDHGDSSAEAIGQIPSSPAVRDQPKARAASDQADYLRHGTFRNHRNNRSTEHFINDLGEDLDITGLLVSGSREAHDSHDAIEAFSRGDDKTTFKPSAKNTASAAPASVSNKNAKASPDVPSLLDDFLTPSTPARATSAISAASPVEDWHMNTRRLQRKTTASNVAPILQVVAPAPTPVAREPAPVVARVEPIREIARSESPRAESNRRPSEANTELQSGVEALCRGAGIDPASIPADAHAAMLGLAGQVVREVVLDLMEALRSRGDHKKRLQLAQTGLMPSQNNPLKLATSVEDALRKLLDGNNTRNLGAVDSIREAFTDLKNHQLAVDAGMNAALNDLLSRVDPTELQERFDRGLKRNAPQSVVNKGKYWELYTDFYPLLNQRDTRGWPAVFTEEFTRAYATKVDELESPRKK